MTRTAMHIPYDRREDLVLEEVRQALRGLHSGRVTIVVQDGVAVQIDRTAEHRLDYSELERVTDGEGI